MVGLTPSFLRRLINSLFSVASPGRYLAAIEMKALLAHIVVTYDIKFEEGKGVPCERQLGLFRLPGDANLLFRKRQT